MNYAPKGEFPTLRFVLKFLRGVLALRLYTHIGKLDFVYYTIENYRYHRIVILSAHSCQVPYYFDTIIQVGEQRILIIGLYIPIQT